MRNLIAFDFSISKPAGCVLSDNNHFFYLWSKSLNKKNEKIYDRANIDITNRTNIEIQDKTIYEITNANILADLIINSLSKFLNKDTIIGFEGTSYGSVGNATISIVAWRYILIYKLSRIIPIENIYTFAPISVKKTAGCSKRGMGKDEMIQSFLNQDLELSNYVNNNSQEFKTRMDNWISHLDDLVDAFWVLETLRLKLDTLPTFSA